MTRHRADYTHVDPAFGSARHSGRSGAAFGLSVSSEKKRRAKEIKKREEQPTEGPAAAAGKRVSNEILEMIKAQIRNKNCLHQRIFQHRKEPKERERNARATLMKVLECFVIRPLPGRSNHILPSSCLVVIGLRSRPASASSDRAQNNRIGSGEKISFIFALRDSASLCAPSSP